MRRALPLFLICAMLLCLPALAADTPLRVDSIRYGATGEGARIVFDLNRKTDFRASLLDKPYRLAVDLPSATWKTYKSRFFSSTLLKSYTSGTMPDGTVRVLFELKKPAIIQDIFVLPKDDMNQDRLVVDLQPSSVNLFRAHMAEVAGKADLGGSAPAAAAKPGPDESYAGHENNLVRDSAIPARKPAAQQLYTIVIDPGHGGQDPGAAGDDVKEKFITLAVARELKRQLEETGRYHVVLTRDRDVYIKLHDRVDISRKVKADLFISIHADKIDRRGVRGASIYTLSERASDNETARLAEDENNAGFVAGVDLSAESQDVANILLDLAMRDKMNESNVFARMLSASFQRSGVRLLPNSHRSAGFAVLKAPDVPSVLIETGFLSNPDEAKLLSSGQFQSSIANAILGGVDEYFRKMQSLHNPKYP